MYRECRHIKTNGQRCHGPALRGKPYCFFHMNLGSMHSPNLAESQRFQLPPIEDNASILLAVGQVIQTLKSPNCDTKRAGLILYALQIAAQLTARQETARPEECVRALYDPAGEDLDFSTALENGTQMLAPEKTICEPPVTLHCRFDEGDRFNDKFQMDRLDPCSACAGLSPHAEAVRIWLCDCGGSRVASRHLFGHSGSRTLLAPACRECDLDRR